MNLDQAEKDAFVAEVGEKLTEFNDSLLDFERNPEDKNLLNSLFRVAHTVKGNAGFVGLDQMVSIGHAVENLFSRARDGEARITPEMVTVIFESLDRMREILDRFRDDQGPAAFNPGELIARINELTAPKQEEAAPETAGPGSGEKTEPGEQPTTGNEGNPGENIFQIRVELKKNIALPGMRAYLVRKKLTNVASILREVPLADDYDSEKFDGRMEFEVSSAVGEAEIRKAIRNHEIREVFFENLNARPDGPPGEGEGPGPENTPPKESAQAGPTPTPPTPKTDIEPAGNEAVVSPVSNEEADTSLSPDIPDYPSGESQISGGEDDDILLVTDDSAPNGEAGEAARRPDQVEMLRVSLRKVDDILNLVGELLSANSAYLALTTEFRGTHGKKGLYNYFRENSEEMARITSELQEKVMKVRMVPVGTVFSRYRRVVRDYNTQNPAKKIELVVEGEETEIDKRQTDLIYDPLLHIIRNSLDHGVEPRAERQAAGKGEEGKILLKSYQSGNNIYIEISDDGRGLDTERIREKAIEKGLINAESSRVLTREQIMELVFLPGFSTAAAVTNISGRGVGMDVVKRTVESLNGTIRLDSEPGRGSRITLKLPLSMAIVTALKVKVRGQLFAIPITVILETIKIREAEVSVLDQSETIEVREHHISLVRLEREIGLDKMDPDSLFRAGRKSEEVNTRRVVRAAGKKPVVIVQYNDSRVGIQVDELLGYEDMVVKSISRNYEEVEGLTGAAVLGKGEICLILDVQRLVDMILKKGRRDPRVAPATPVPGAKPAGGTPVSLPGKAPGRLSEEQVGRVQKIIGTSRRNALNAIREMASNPKINMKYTATRIRGQAKFRDYMEKAYGGREVHAYYVDLELGLRGKCALVISRENMLKLAAMMYEEDEFDSINMEVLSAIREVTNVLAVAFTNAINALTGVRVFPTAPEHLPDSRQLLSKILFEKQSRLIMVETEFTLGGRESILEFFFIPRGEEFLKLTEKALATV